MVDFTTPNLCGASEQFNKLAGQFASIKDTLQGSLEAEIDTLKGELTGSLSVLEADIKGLIPELPEIPDVSLISEIQNLVSLPTGSLSSLTSLANIKLKFGDALDEAGFSLDSLVSDATSAFSGGIDLCGGGIPNFVIGPNGKPTQKAEDAGMPDGDPVDEDGADLTTPSAEINTSNAALAGDAAAASAVVKENLPKTDIASESGNVSDEAKTEYAKKDAIMRAKLQKDGSAPSPQVQKVSNATATDSNLPIKDSLLSADDIIVELKQLQNRLTVANNNLNKAGQRLGFIITKTRKPDPENILASGTEKLVRDNSKSFRLEVSGLPTIADLALTTNPFVRSKLSFAGKNHSIGKLANGINKVYYKNSGLVSIVIKQAYQANDPDVPGNTGRLKGRLDRLTPLVTDVEKSSERFVKIYDEMTNQIEKTYAVPV